MKNTGLEFYNSSSNELAYFKKDLNSSPFKILNFTDLHLHDGGAPPELVLTIMERYINMHLPDLVTITGDICLKKGEVKYIHLLNNMFTKLNQYYAITLGNHDGERGNLNRADITKLYSSFPYCITELGPNNIYGYGNQFVLIKDLEDNIQNCLVFMDSGDYIKNSYKQYGLKNTGHYDAIKPDQIQWYIDNMNNIKADNNGVLPPSALFIHIALPEYKIAYDIATKQQVVNKKRFCFGRKKLITKTANLNASLLAGQRQEAECAPHINTGLFEQLVKHNTSLVICGHDHINDYVVEFNGVKLAFSLSLAYSAYNTRRRKKRHKRIPDDTHHTDGSSLIVPSKDGFQITHLYNQDYSQIFDGLDPFIEASTIDPLTLPKKFSIY